MSEPPEFGLSLMVELRGGEWTPTEVGGLLQTILRLRKKGGLPPLISVSLSFVAEGAKMVVVGSPNLYPDDLDNTISALKDFLGETADVVTAAKE